MTGIHVRFGVTDDYDSILRIEDFKHDLKII